MQISIEYNPIVVTENPTHCQEFSLSDTYYTNDVYFAQSADDC